MRSLVQTSHEQHKKAMQVQYNQIPDIDFSHVEHLYYSWLQQHHMVVFIKAEVMQKKS